MVFYTPTLIDLTQAIRVDMVGLPSKETARLPEKAAREISAPNVEEKKENKIEKLPEKVKPVKETPDNHIVDLKKVKNKQKEALDNLKKLSAVEKIKQELKNEAQQNLAKPNSAPIKGRVISAGSSITGLDKLEANTYLQDLDAQVKNHWALPQWLMNKPYKTQILVKFNADGKIISRSVLKSSGQTSYDNYCLQSVDEAAPFPKVPEKFTEKFSQDGVVIGFPE